jgi:hypothetical protein
METQFEQDFDRPFCECCDEPLDGCTCPECPRCGEYGNPGCYDEPDDVNCGGLYETVFDERTITALKGSIEKWQAIVNGTGHDDGVVNCPLCQAFKYKCVGCPVFNKTGSRYCSGTPYNDWSDYDPSEEELLELTPEQREAKSLDKVFNAESKRLAQAELDFLKSLLPQEEE